MKQVSAGIVIYRKTNQGLLFLLLFHGGKYWSFPKGKIDAEERAWQTALREVGEETGITAKHLEFEPNFRTSDHFTFRADKQTINKTVVYFLARARKSQVVIAPREHRGYGWFTYKEAMNILPHKNLRNTITKAYEALQGKEQGRGQH